MSMREVDAVLEAFEDLRKPPWNTHEMKMAELYKTLDALKLARDSYGVHQKVLAKDINIVREFFFGRATVQGEYIPTLGVVYNLAAQEDDTPYQATYLVIESLAEKMKKSAADWTW